METVSEFASSGMSIRGFAASKGLPTTTFCAWVKKLRVAAAEAQGPKAAFIELKPADPGRPEADPEVTVDFMGARISMPASALPGLIGALREKR